MTDNELDELIGKTDALPIPSIVGTFLRVVPYGNEFYTEDSLQVLYVRESGLFLFIGYWQGFELTVAAGNWRRDADILTLEGLGATLLSDCWPYRKEKREFHRQFTIQRQLLTPVLVADDDLKGWGLLGWRGPFTYVGKRHFVETGRPMPQNWREIDDWVDRFVSLSQGSIQH